MPKFKLQNLDRSRRTFLFVQALTGSFLILAARQVYLTHSYYQSLLTADPRNLVSDVMVGLLVLFLLDALRKFLFVEHLGPTKMTRIFALWLKLVYNVMEFINGKKRYVKLEIDRDTKTALLSLVVKFFYIPLMLNFLYGNYAGLVSNLSGITYSTQSGIEVTFQQAFDLLVTALFTVDTAIFTFGYLIELDFLGNKIRSVEPTMLGWVAALSTYPPFNTIPSLFFVMVQGEQTAIWQNVNVAHAIMILVLLCHLVFVACSVALGPKGSNLTNRGTVSWGPYAIVRHPAYVAKLAAWFLMGVLYAPNLGYFTGWAGFAFIYYMRAITEERHLSQDPDYVEYKSRVKYRFFPKLI